MTSRVLFAYAVLLFVGVLVAFGLVDEASGRRALLVPAICALLVGGLAFGATWLGERPALRFLVLRIGSTLPLIVGAALSMRAIRIAKAVDDGAAGLDGVATVLWGLAGVSFVAFLALQFARFRHGSS